MSVYLDTREPLYVFFLSSCHTITSWKYPTKILSCVQLKHPFIVDWSERNDHSCHCGLPSVTFDAFLLLLCTSGISHLSALQQHTLVDCKSLRYCQPYQELYRCLWQIKEIIYLVPRGLWKGPWPNCSKKRTVSCQVKQSAAWLSQASAENSSQLAAQALGLCLRHIPIRTPDQLIITEQQEDFFPLCGQDKQLWDLMKAVRSLLYHKHWASAPTYPCLYSKHHTHTPFLNK